MKNQKIMREEYDLKKLKVKRRGLLPELKDEMVLAVAEKISVLETEQYFCDRMLEADMDAFRSLLFRPGGEPARAGDELS